MSDLLVLCNVRAVCQDGVTREGGVLVVRDDQYVFLDGEGEALEGDRRVVELVSSIAPMHPNRLSMVTARYGPIFS